MNREFLHETSPIKSDSMQSGAKCHPFNSQLYPLKWINRCDDIKRTGLKSSNKPELVINGHSHTQSNSFINDAARIWNEAPLTNKRKQNSQHGKKTNKIIR